MSYRPQQQMSRPARGGAALWRTVAGACFTLALYVALLVGFVGVLETMGGPRLVAEFAEGDTPRGALLVLFSFLFMAAGPLIVAQPLHRRSAASLFGPPSQAVRDFLRVAGALAVLSAALWFVLSFEVDLRQGLALGTWLALLPLTALAILVQSGAEELVFRGYLQGQLAARFRSPLVWMLLPSALFAWGHHAPGDAGANAVWLTLLAFAFGVAAADLTARAGNLGAAIAFHFVNNVLALAVTALPGPFSGLALTLLPVPADDPAITPLLWLDLAAIVLSWLAARVALRV